VADSRHPSVADHLSAARGDTNLTNAAFEGAPLGAIRYIKLGRGGSYAAQSLDAGELNLGHRRVSHELASSGDKMAIADHFVSLGHSPGKAKDFAREITDFYRLGPETLWFTFVDGYLWWAHAEPEVVWTGDWVVLEGEPRGARHRRIIGEWRNTDALGRPLLMSALSTRLTKVAGYRQTLCSIGPDAERYLRRKLAGETDPIVDAALEAKRTLVEACEALIAGLHWADFETLVDVLLARGGWNRMSELGGAMKDADLIVEQATTGETAMVQVKSAATPSTLEDYIRRFDDAGEFSRLIFACHSPRGALAAPDRDDVMVWTRSSLAETAVRNGLVDWLIARAG
jgi:hypothetical protein